MKTSLESVESQIKTQRNFESPPLHLWHPPLSGNIPIYINAQGDWYHDGTRIERHSLVKLFASILRREEDGEYYLVTPAEKWRIEVELHPLIITDFDRLVIDGIPLLEATLNTDRKILISEEHSLFLEPKLGDIATLKLAHGLTAVCTRSAWYRLVELATAEDGEAVLSSGDYKFSLTSP